MAASVSTSRRRGLVKLTSRPDLVAQIHPTLNGPDFDPSLISVGSNKKLHWRCSTNPAHEWEAVIASRTAGKGCPYCAGRLLDPARSLAALYPELAAQLHPSTPKK